MKSSVARMKTLRWMSGNKRKDRIRNLCISEKVKMATNDDKMRGTGLCWFGATDDENIKVAKRRDLVLDKTEKEHGLV